MKLKIISFLLAIIAAVSLLTLAACKEEPDDKWKNEMYLILVNKDNAVDKSFEPKGLTKIPNDYVNGVKSIELEQKTCEAVIAMLDAMKAEGIIDVTVTSGYRTYEYQQTLFERYCANEKEAHPAWSDSEVKDYVLTYSAYPGTSEHQTGLCVDLITTEMVGLWNYGIETPNNPWDKGFAETSAFMWLQANAHKYGFILRFPENKTDVTGYSYESWHYRYVGVEHATKIHEEGITLEEYLAK